MEGAAGADPTHPLFGKTVCFTGALLAMLRREAAEIVVSLGADFVDNMSKKVDYLVIGDGDFVAFADGQRTGKMDKALKIREKGAPLEIISERDFFELVGSD